MIPVALNLRIEALIEDGDPITEVDEELLAEDGAAPPTLWTRFELAEIEVPAPQRDA